MAGEMTYICPRWDCEESFESEDACREHELQKHIICPKCGCGFGSQRRLAMHWIHSKHLHYCPVCKKGFATTDEWEDYGHVCRPYEITCPACKMIAPNSELYNKHWKRSGRDGDHREYLARNPHNRCQDARCEEFLPTEESFKQHIQDGYVCQRCYVHFYNYADLKTHRLCHQPTSHPCIKNCGTTFSSYWKMLEHVETHGCSDATYYKDIETILARSDIALDCMTYMAIQKAAFPSERQDSPSPNSSLANVHPMDQALPYHCMGCAAECRGLSSLFHHWEESNDCQQGFDDEFVDKIKQVIEGRSCQRSCCTVLLRGGQEQSIGPSHPSAYGS